MAVPSLGHRRRAIAAVAEELRTPVLWAPTTIASTSRLRLVRRLERFAVAKVHDGVEASTETFTTSDGAVRDIIVYEPAGRVRPSGAVLWIHGGGMILGHPGLSHEVCSDIARSSGALVASVDYRLAPEFPFPTPANDCLDALAWLHGAVDRFGVDPLRVAVGGESAGGGLAATVAQMARDRGDLPLAFQALVYPMLDDRTAVRVSAPGRPVGRGEFIWTPASNRFGWTSYLGRDAAVSVTDDRPYCAPARTDDLSGLPPAWIGVGDLDLFFDEDVEYSSRLGRAGVACDLHVVERMYHGADGLRPKTPAMREFRRRLLDAIGGAIG